MVKKLKKIVPNLFFSHLWGIMKTSVFIVHFCLKRADLCPSVLEAAIWYFVFDD